MMTLYFYHNLSYTYYLLSNVYAQNYIFHLLFLLQSLIKYPYLLKAHSALKLLTAK